MSSEVGKSSGGAVRATFNDTKLRKLFPERYGCLFIGK